MYSSTIKQLNKFLESCNITENTKMVVRIGDNIHTIGAMIFSQGLLELWASREPIQTNNLENKVTNKPVSAIWLRKAQNKQYPNIDDVIVSVEINGIWYEAIKEIADNNFDHCIELKNYTLEANLPIDSVLNIKENTDGNR